MAYMESGSTATGQVELLVLGFGMAHAYRVFSLAEVADAMPHINKELLRQALDQLAERDLLTTFAGRYCFNKEIPSDVKHSVEQYGGKSGAARCSPRRSKAG